MRGKRDVTTYRISRVISVGRKSLNVRIIYTALHLYIRVDVMNRRQMLIFLSHIHTPASYSIFCDKSLKVRKKEILKTCVFEYCLQIIIISGRYKKWNFLNI